MQIDNSFQGAEVCASRVRQEDAIQNMEWDAKSGHRYGEYHFIVKLGEGVWVYIEDKTSFVEIFEAEMDHVV